MRINLDQENIDKCYRTLCAKEINMETAEFYIEYLTEYPFSITKKDIEKISKNHSIQESFFIAMKNKMEIEDDDDTFIEMNDLCNIKNIQKLSTKKYINNPFYKRIPVTNQKLGKWQLMKLNYQPYEGFVYDELDIHPERDYGEHTPLGFFEETFPYLAIIEDDQIWMSVIPHEINTMDKPIKAAFGNILVLGLGIGYYAYMTSLKNDVESITIIESDVNAIKLFNEWIFPYFENKDKIKIIKSDAFEYLKNNDISKYDYCFSDIWHNAGDGIYLYLKIKNFEQKYQCTYFDYWIETSILALLRRYVLTVYEEQMDGSTDEDYMKAIDENDVLVNKLYFFLKDYEINSYEDLMSLLSNDSLKKLARELNY